jgi:F-type H+-transporting ATPase subunit a
MNVWAILKTVRKLLVSALVVAVAWLAFINSPLWLRFAQAASDTPQDNKPHAEKADLKAHPEDHKDEPKHNTDDHQHGGGHHQPTAMEHVLDSNEFELFMSFGPKHIELPNIFGVFQITKFMVLEIIAALLVIAIYVPLARKVQTGGVTRGSWNNFFEVLLTFIRDQVAKPALGGHDADKHLPFLWTLFLFILFNNLLGMIPFGGSATASIFVTLGLALCVFLYMHGSAIAKMGWGHYFMSLWPDFDVPLPFPLGFLIKLLIFAIEWGGILVRNVVLAVRLFANMFAGHMVLATLLIFILMAQDVHPALWTGITIGSVAGILALSLLELFVAVLQAYIFTFLTALFMGMALHPQH